MKKILVGKNGYIATRFLNKCSDVICTSSTDEKALKLDLEKPEQFDYSVVDADTMVILMAAISAPDVCRDRPEFAYSVNVTGTGKFIEGCLAKGAKVLFFSSDTVYGDTGGVEADENARLKPSGVYAEMKAEIENKYADEKNFKSFRLSYVFSKNDGFSKFLKSCVDSGEVVDIFDPFDRSVVYIEDVVDAVLALDEKWGSVKAGLVNLCGPKVLSRVEYAEIFSEYFDGKLNFEVVNPPESFFKARPKVINMVSKELEGLLGRPQTSLKDAVKIEFAGDK